MRKKLGAIVLCTFFVLTACGPQQKDMIEQTEAATTQAATTAPETTTAAEETTAEASPDGNETIDISGLSAMLGASDAEAKNMLGGGTENRTEDKTILIGRQYGAVVLGEDVTVNTMYDDNEDISLVQVVFTGKDSKAYNDVITKELGTEPEQGGDSEAGATSTIWQKEGKMYTLFNTAGESTLEIIIPQN